MPRLRPRPVGGALRLASEHLHLDTALGMSVWSRDHADYQMTVPSDLDPFRYAKT